MIARGFVWLCVVAVLAAVAIAILLALHLTHGWIPYAAGLVVALLADWIVRAQRRSR